MMFYDEDDEARRPQVTHLRRLIELTEAKESFISVRQLERFYARPDGPRVPAECLEARPLVPRGMISRQEAASMRVDELFITPQG